MIYSANRTKLSVGGVNENYGFLDPYYDMLNTDFQLLGESSIITEATSLKSMIEQAKDKIKKVISFVMGKIRKVFEKVKDYISNFKKKSSSGAYQSVENKFVSKCTKSDITIPEDAGLLQPNFHPTDDFESIVYGPVTKIDNVIKEMGSKFRSYDPKKIADNPSEAISDYKQWIDDNTGDLEDDVEDILKKSDPRNLFFKTDSATSFTVSKEDAENIKKILDDPDTLYKQFNTVLKDLENCFNDWNKQFESCCSSIEPLENNGNSDEQNKQNHPGVYMMKMMTDVYSRLIKVASTSEAKLTGNLATYFTKYISTLHSIVNYGSGSSASNGEKFEYNKFEPDKFEPKKFEPDKFDKDQKETEKNINKTKENLDKAKEISKKTDENIKKFDEKKKEDEGSSKKEKNTEAGAKKEKETNKNSSKNTKKSDSGKFEYDKFEPDKFEPDKFETDKFEPNKF